MAKQHKVVKPELRQCRRCGLWFWSGYWHICSNCLQASRQCQRASDPTPEEIRQRCEEVQQKWDANDERRRRGAKDEPLTFPVVSFDVTRAGD